MGIINKAKKIAYASAVIEANEAGIAAIADVISNPNSVSAAADFAEKIGVEIPEEALNVLRAAGPALGDLVNFLNEAPENLGALINRVTAEVIGFAEDHGIVAEALNVLSQTGVVDFVNNNAENIVQVILQAADTTGMDDVLDFLVGCAEYTPLGALVIATKHLPKAFDCLIHGDLKGLAKVGVETAVVVGFSATFGEVGGIFQLASGMEEAPAALLANSLMKIAGDALAGNAVGVVKTVAGTAGTLGNAAINIPTRVIGAACAIAGAAIGCAALLVGRKREKELETQPEIAEPNAAEKLEKLQEKYEKLSAKILLANERLDKVPGFREHQEAKAEIDAYLEENHRTSCAKIANNGLELSQFGKNDEKLTKLKENLSISEAAYQANEPDVLAWVENNVPKLEQAEARLVELAEEIQSATFADLEAGVTPTEHKRVSSKKRDRGKDQAVGAQA